MIVEQLKLARSVLKCVLLFTLGTASAAATDGSPMQFTHLGADSGLSAGGVMAILQDSQGFIWLGTEDGLDRYDGYKLQHHVHDPARPGTLPSNWISSLAEGDDGTLWVGTDGGGLVGRDRDIGDFRALPRVAGEVPINPQQTVRVLSTDRDGVLWVGTRDDGLVMVDQRRAIVRHFRYSSDDAASLSSNSVYALVKDPAGSMWVGTASGLDRLDPGAGRVDRQSLPLGQLPSHSSSVAVNALLSDRSGNLWVGTSRGLLRRQPGALNFEAYRHRDGDVHALPGDRIQALYQDREHRLWVGTSAGLALYDQIADRFDVYRHDPADPSTLPDDSVISIFEDRGGQLWVGTKEGGAAIWNSRSWSFGEHAGAIGQTNVAAFAQDPSGTLWVSNLGAGLDAIDRIHGTVTHFRRGAHSPLSLPDDRVTALLVDAEGALWIGTMTAGLSRIDPERHSLKTLPYAANQPGSLGVAGVMSLLQDSHGRVWVGTYGGGLSVVSGGDHFIRYSPDLADPAALSSDRVTALAEDPSGRIWVGTDGAGLCVFDPSSGRFFRFVHDPQDPHTVSANTVYSIRVDPRGRVWVGTRGGGLDEVVGSAMDPAHVGFRNFSQSDGLPNTTIYGIETDARGQLWLSTNRGLSRFDPASHEVRNFGREHGLQGDEFNFGAHYRSRAGELFFGGPNGYNAFFPERLQFDDQAPQVVLTALLKLNEPARTARPYERLNDIDLNYRDDVVSFEFAGLDYSAPAQNRYRYRLEGFDKNWVEAGTKHQVTYTNLMGGHYVFRVMAANSDGVWNEAGLAIPVNVQPPPWKTPWAYSLYVAGFMGLIFLVWNHQHKKLRREERYAKRLSQDVRDRTLELAQRNDELELVNRQLKVASLTDPLTGLGNRRYVQDAVGALLVDQQAEAGLVLSLMIVDLDHLKPINDAHGHEAGDKIILDVADILRETCRPTDFIARWGGDEFVVVLRDQDLDAAAELAERIRGRVAKQSFRLPTGTTERSSCSIGFSRYPFVRESPGLLSWEQCLAAADTALYHAKKQRNGWLGLAGTAAAARLTAIVRLLEIESAQLERDGYLEVRRSLFRADDTVTNLRGRRRADA